MTATSNSSIPAGAAVRPRANRRESGYVTAMTALLLIPLMVFAALTVDVGAWYFQASDAQSASDAAALAGVPLMPDRVRARAAAIDVATRNGYVDGVDGVSINITYPSSRSIDVEIVTPSDRYFSGIVLNNTFDIQRAGTAEYVLPIPMGSPVNVLGFGDNDGPLRAGDMPPANFWMLEGSDCQDATFGDVSGAKYNDKIGGSWCGDRGPARAIWKKNSEDREGGYFYVVDIPPGQTKVSEFWVYDPGVCPGDGEGKPAGSGSRMAWRSWSSNGTPLIPDDDTVIGDGSYWTSNDCAKTHVHDANEGWVKSTISFPANPDPSGDPVRYYIQSKGLQAKNGWNMFAFWIRPHGTNGVCFTTADPTCPTIAAENWIVVRAQGEKNEVGDPAIPMELYLAEIPPIHTGKTLNVVLWDVGEGMDNIQILDPNGDSLDFTWTSDDTRNAGYTGVYASDNNASCEGNPCLWLDPGSSHGYPPKLDNFGWYNSWRFNGRIVTLAVPLDGQVDYGSYTDFWFKIRFLPKTDFAAKEWASFSINVSGDPVRLTD